jgi:3-deoxy-manno-octulosonate cytidylyltransferase (CMP-KDO synthetase)
MTEIIALIPARMGSSRFPGKPMAELLGYPMIGHVYKRVALNTMLSLTAVATCDREISDYINSIGGRAVMTSSHHERASDRCAEGLKILENEEGKRFDIVVMVQGDEPMTSPEMISEAIEPMLEDPEIKVVNLIGEIKSIEEFDDPNCIKVVCDLKGNAIYFSREPIPTRSKKQEIPMLKQVCTIPFRRDFLLDYTNMEPTPLEIAESIDMLRVLENGMKVRMVQTKYQSYAVDTKEDLKKVSELMKESGTERF